MSHNVFVVDAYSTGSDLPWRLKQQNFNVVHIANNINAPELISSLDNRFIDQTISLSSYKNMDELFTELSIIPPCHVIPGTETGIELADIIAEKFSLTGNSTSTSINRRNKTLMQDSLKKSGLDHIKGLLIKSLDDVDLAIPKNIDLPCVVKPEMSAGADDVFFCYSIDDVKKAVQKIVGSTNQIGGYNLAALVQEMLVGVQYFINAVSVSGRHYISEIWQDLRVQTNEGRIVSDREILLDGTGELQTEIGDYVKSVLTSLGIEHGASHTELMMTKRGPVLIETAARMQGTILPSAVEKALGYSHPSILTDSTIDPQNFAQSFVQPYKRNKHLNVVTLISKNEGLIVKSHLEELLAILSSYVGVIHTPSVGDYLNKTIDLFTNPGTIYLCSDNPEELEADYDQIRDWEASGDFFELQN